ATACVPQGKALFFPKCLTKKSKKPGQATPRAAHAAQRSQRPPNKPLAPLRCVRGSGAVSALEGGRSSKDRNQPVVQSDGEMAARGSEGDGAGVSDRTEVEIPALVGAGGGLPEPGLAVQRSGGDPVALRVKDRRPARRAGFTRLGAAGRVAKRLA